MTKRREPARWRWTSKAKTRRELWRGMTCLAVIERKRAKDTGLDLRDHNLDAESEVYVWRAVYRVQCEAGGFTNIDSGRWGISSKLPDVERVAKAVGLKFEAKHAGGAA